MGIKQVETATVVGTVTLSGNAKVIITSAYMAGSPYSVSVAVLNLDNASAVAGKIRAALVIDATVAAEFLVTGAAADVVSTSHVAKSNDTTLNISIDNDTCTGLTAAPISVNTLSGSGIANGYCTLLEAKQYLNPKGLSINAVDDNTIEIMIGMASRYIDSQTNDVWYTTTAVRIFDAPALHRDILFFDDRLQSITTITNGDGVAIASTEYQLLPINKTPKYGIQLLSNSVIGWQPKNGSMQQAIEINGVWGNVLPDDIKTACLQITIAAYKRRTGENSNSKTLITSGGVVVMADDVPGIAQDIINSHRRIVIC